MRNFLAFVGAAVLTFLAMNGFYLAYFFTFPRRTLPFPSAQGAGDLQWSPSGSASTGGAARR